MDNFNFYSPTEFVFGRDAENRCGECAARHGGSRVLIVYGGGSAVRSGLLGRVETALEAAGIAHAALGGVRPNPTDDKVREGIALCRAEGIDMLLAVGGGSVIDTAKAIAAGVPYEGDFWDFFEHKATVEEALPVGTVLTIPAAGSEGSGNSVITNAALQKKISLRTPRALRPRFSILNPCLTFTLPAAQTAAGATDMMAHIMERYFTNTPDTAVTDALSEALLRTIADAAPQAIARPDDYAARATLMWCGTLAHNGLCGTGCEEDWASHFMEHEVSAIYDVTHGAGLAVIFPAWLTWMARHHAVKTARWARNVWGVPEGADDTATTLDGIGRFKQWLRSVGMPVTFAELGVGRPDIALLNNRLHKHMGTTVGHYVPLTAADTEEIYRLAL